MLHVRVRNFQSIKDATVVIDGFTALTGTNNAGKSALFRAIKGVFTNPAPSFVRHGAKYSTVEITDKTKDLYVKWEKGGGKNDYELRTSEGTERFVKVGKTGAPPQVLEAFGIGSLQAGNATLWPQFAEWKTGPLFLLDKPGSAIADGVANVDRITVLNKALKACESDRRQAVSTLKLRKTDQEAIEEQLAAFEGLDAVVKNLDELQTQRDQADRVKAGREKLVSLKRQYTEAREQVDALEGFEEVAASMPTKERVRESRDLERELQEYCKLQRDLRDARSHVEALKKLGDVGNQIPSQEVLTGLQRLQEGLQKLVQLRDRLVPLQEEIVKWREAAEIARASKLGEDSVLKRANKIRQILKWIYGMRTEIQTSRDLIEGYEQELAGKQKELDALLEALGSVLADYDECPLCGATIEHEHEHEETD